MNEQVLGHFFNYKRTHLDPADYQITVSKRRRTTGLKRDEIADLAHVSLDWYTRIEQGRENAKPSTEILAALCQTMRLTSAEIQYVFHLADKLVPTPLKPAVTTSDHLQLFLDQQAPNPAFIMDQFLTITAWNQSFTQLYGDLSKLPQLERNAVWRTFNVPALKSLFTDWPTRAQQRTAQFRQIYSTAADDPFLWKVFEAVRQDATFQSTWQQLTVQGFPEQLLLLNHPQLGPLYLHELTLKTTTTNRYICIQTAGDQPTQQVLTQTN